MEEDNEQYEYEDYDEDDEVEGSEAEEEEEEEEYEDLAPTREEQEFLKLREQLKEQIRQKMKKESDNHSSQSQDKNGTAANDKFGSFFGPSKPVIAARVLVESRSIRETQHIAAKNKSGPVLTSADTKTRADLQQQNVKDVPKIVDKVKALKEKRDYSFLLSDDPDLPDPIKEEPAPQKTPVQNSGNAFQSAAGNPQHVPQKASGQKSAGKPAKLVGNGHQMSSASVNRHVQSKIGSKPGPAGARKGIESNGNGSGQPLRRVALPQKVNARGTGPMNIASTSGTKKPLSAKSDSSIQNQSSEKRRVAQGQDKLKATQKQSLPSSRIQPKPSSARNIHGERPKKRPLVNDEYEACVTEIRNMFRYNPSDYRDIDRRDDRDMEVGFDAIMREEKRSARLAREEDAEQLRLLEEEEARERKRKKLKSRQ